MRPAIRSRSRPGPTTINTSARTLARRFQSETGLSFGAWRQQARVLEAMGRLGGGDPVTQVALDLGYESVSAFSAMFRRAAGAPRPANFRRRADCISHGTLDGTDCEIYPMRTPYWGTINRHSARSAAARAAPE